MALVPIRGANIRLIDGSYFYFEQPELSTFTVAGIAHSLSMLCRFTGHVKRFYSVAQHSVGVSLLVPQEMALAALLHDACEAFINDIASPLKHSDDMEGYRRVEARAEAAVFPKLGVADYLLPMHRDIKRADLIMLATEQRDLMPPSDDEWGCLDGIEPLPGRIVALYPRKAAALFMRRYAELGGK